MTTKELARNILQYITAIQPKQKLEAFLPESRMIVHNGFSDGVPDKHGKRNVTWAFEDMPSKRKNAFLDNETVVLINRLKVWSEPEPKIPEELAPFISSYKGQFFNLINSIDKDSFQTRAKSLVPAPWYEKLKDMNVDLNVDLDVDLDDQSLETLKLKSDAEQEWLDHIYLVFQDFSSQYKTWQEKKKEHEAMQAIYQKTYNTYQQLFQDGAAETTEVAFGVGEIWQPYYRGPILVQPCEVVMVQKQDALEIRQAIARVKLNPSLALVCNDEMKFAAAERAFARWVEEHDDFSLLDINMVREVCDIIVGQLVQGNVRRMQTLQKDTQPKADETLVLDKVAVFIRERPNDRLTTDLKSLDDCLRKPETVLPPSIESIVSPKDELDEAFDIPPFIGAQHGVPGDDTQHLYFPLPYNEEQLKIIETLEKNTACVVQGPPGTGKSHTIANIISHYLAKGKRVLVTAAQAQALEVIRDKLPKDIRALSATLLSSDQKSKKEFEYSVSHISGKLGEVMSSGPKREHLSRESWRLTHERMELEETINRILEQHENTLSVAGKTWNPEDLLQEILRNANVEPLQDRLSDVSAEDIEGVLEKTTQALEKIGEYGLFWNDDLVGTMPIWREKEWFLALRPEGLRVMNEKHEDVQKLVDETERDESQAKKILETLQISEEDALNKLRIFGEQEESVEEYVAGVERYQKKRMIPRYHIELGNNYRDPDFKAALKKMMEGGTFLFLSPAARLTKGVLVNGVPPTSNEMWGEALDEWIRRESARNIFEKWRAFSLDTERPPQGMDLDDPNIVEWCIESARKFLMTIKAGKTVYKRNQTLEHFRVRYLNDLKILVENQKLWEEAEKYRQELESYLRDNRGSTVDTLISNLRVDIHEAHQNIFNNSSFFQEQDHGEDHNDNPNRNEGRGEDEREGLGSAETGTETGMREGTKQKSLQKALKTDYRYLYYNEDDMREVRSKLAQELQELNKKSVEQDGNKGRSALLVEAQKQKEKDNALFDDVHGYLRQAVSLQKETEKSKELQDDYHSLREGLEALERWGAHSVVRNIKSSLSKKQRASLPAGLKKAWWFNVAYGKMNALPLGHDIRRLMERRSEVCDQLRKVYEEMVTLEAWDKLQKNATPKMKSQLQSYLNAVSKISKSGEGKRDIRFRHQARQAMEDAYMAVPCWIMPIGRVAESMPPELGIFDLVIVDEASQANVEMMVAAMRGKKILVVGDDKQVSPIAAGTSESSIIAMRQTYLSKIPAMVRDQMMKDSSFYDLAGVAYAATRITLWEHFRSAPEIISFSNDNYYDGKIVPLRTPKRNERIVPSIESIFVEGGTKEGDINMAEAEAVVQAVVSFMESSDRPRSIGIVTLSSKEKQAILIRSLLDLRLEETDLDMAEWNIACGLPNNFQGMERDVMFISMVWDENNRGRGTNDFDKKVNVALSRARDKMILVHSLPLAKAKPESALRSILEFFAHPPESLPKDRFASKFESDLALVLREKGYTVYNKVGSRDNAIDLVVEDQASGNRLGIMCDGDGASLWQESLQKQAVLERAGWSIVRVFARDFYLSKEQTVSDVLALLDSFGIKPHTEEEPQDKQVLMAQRTVQADSLIQERKPYVFNPESLATQKIRQLKPTSPETEREKIDSGFEGSIIDHLAGKVQIHAQVGFEGYRMDIIAHDNERHLVIECDGDNYHKDQEEDRKRQSFLEANGFVFHRIWASDFFQDKERALRMLDESLRWAGLID